MWKKDNMEANRLFGENVIPDTKDISGRIQNC